MCGILAYKEKGNNEFIKNRGETSHRVQMYEMTFIHTLLPITGESLLQPIIEDDIILMYNGEIYNYPFIKSDGEVLIPLYKEHGMMFCDKLDGEYAIALYDFKNDLALFITDPFGTKPLWRNGIECASYESGVGGHQIEPNTVEGVRISTEEEIFKFKYHKWDWNQYKTSYDDWLKVFEKAVRKRAKDGCFIGLSSGYDSGAISKELSKQGIKFKAYSVLNNENEDVIRERAKYCYEWEEIRPELSLRDELKERVEEVEYKFCREKTVIDDDASVGLGAICKKANREGRKVCLSGQGADEIIGDYKLFPKQSNFKGNFPTDLKEWTNFSGGLQRDYLNKEEYIGGAYSIETRYPFLDRDLVQEFLWLAPALKNAHYKAPIREYLIKNSVPFEEGVKKGFRI